MLWGTLGPCMGHLIHGFGSTVKPISHCLGIWYTVATLCACGLTDKALVFGTRDWGFDSLQARQCYNFVMETQKPEPIKTINENVSTLEVARYYLKVEFTKLFPSVPFELIRDSIDSLKDKNVFSLLEAMSFTYHLNGVYYNITREGYDWKEEIWDINKLVMTGMDPNVNKVIFSEEVNGDVTKFKSYLLDYFEKNVDNDPQGLFSFKPSNKPINFPKLIAKVREGKLRMLDGSHRLTEMLLNGVSEVHVYAGHPVTQIPDEKQKTKIGSSTFILLTIAYKQGTAEERKAVITVTRQLMNRSTDGKEAVQKYWVDRQQDNEIKEAGRLLLGA